MATSPSTPANASSNTAQDLAYKSTQLLADGSAATMTATAGAWGYNAISTATTTVVDSSGAGQLNSLIVVGGTLGAITVYDNTAASGTVIVPTFTPVAMTGSGPQVYTLNVSYSVGLTVVTAAATALVVTYR